MARQTSPWTWHMKRNKIPCFLVTIIVWHVILQTVIRGPFAKFVNSHYYSELELCGGAVTVSFSKYLPWQAMHFIQRHTHLSTTCCRPLITSKFLASEFPFHGWKSPEISWGEIWIEFCVRLGKSGSTPLEHPPYSPDLGPCNFWAFPTTERELRGKKFRNDGRSAARFREVGGAF
jgi:hypothetical protein